MNIIITFGRQFGSGGAEIGKKLSDIMGIEYYDKEILVKAAENSGIDRDVFERADERATSSFLYSLAMSSYSGHISPLGVGDVMMSDKVFTLQSDEIKRLASKGSAVFVGRCADDILFAEPGLAKIFIHAPLEDRVKRIMEKLELNEQSARKLITKTDKKRASYYNFYTSKNWGDAKNYHLSIDSSFLGIEGTAEVIKNFVSLRKLQ
ncbi:MAG: cytidylate kinase-like family protein [Eubacteriales bacterium]|nr:cytidylate kinase-like family protein [Eubacteriales bacterium]MDD4422366.1 cytidylate kinase-like family protein [Eubacteriales bacterium]HBR30916.1 cytidylate kinase [Clostridiales bacterium]